MTDLRHDPAVATAFLEAFHPGRAWALTSIATDKKRIDTATFDTARHAELAEWLARHAADNVYFSVAELLHEVQKKASKEDLKAVHWLHVDLDPRAGEDLEAERTRILKRLRDHLPRPTAICFSGGGYQGFWRLSEPFVIDGKLDRAEELERYNIQLVLDLEGDNGTHNADRIMRLPGTVNWPDERKRKKGRTPAMACVIELLEGDHLLQTFGRALPPTVEEGDTPALRINPENIVRIGGLADLPENVSETCRQVIAQGRDPDRPERWPSDSEALFFVVCDLVRAGVPDEVTYSVITDPRFGISKTVTRLGRKSHEYALRQIRRAKDSTGDFAEDEGGKPRPTIANVRMAISKLGVEFEQDDFSDRLLVHGLAGYGPGLSDNAATVLWGYLEERYGFNLSMDRAVGIMKALALANRRHPVREYLDCLQWDGRERISEWLPIYAGSESNPYVRAVGRLTLVAAVRRIRQPGAKFDEMLILEGPQGRGKSSLIATLAVNEDWFSDDLPLGADTKRFMEAVAGRWIIEAGELTGMRRSDVEALNACLSRRVDRSRLAYGRMTTELPRQFIMIGTTNSDRYLRSSHGNRRYWPVVTGAVDLEALRRDRDQIWAEAAFCEARGDPVRLDPSLYAAAAEQQEERMVEDPFLHNLSEALGDQKGKIRAVDIWAAAGIPEGQRSQDHNERLGSVMLELGWRRRKLRFEGKPRWVYTNGEGPQLGVTICPDGSVRIAPETEPRF